MMPDILVTCFSRSGSTEMVARQLAERLGADLDLIRAPDAYAGVIGFAHGVWQTIFQRTPPVETARDPAAYALVIVGTPVWGGRPSAPVRGYLRAYGRQIRAMAAYCLSGSGQPYPGVFEDMAHLAGVTPRATLSLAEKDVRSDGADVRVRQFAESLRAGLA